MSISHTIEKKRVYCNYCRWLIQGAGGARCRYPENVTIKNTWYNKEEKFLKKPSDLNAKNDCGWFMSKKKDRFSFVLP